MADGEPAARRNRRLDRAMLPNAILLGIGMFSWAGGSIFANPITPVGERNWYAFSGGVVVVVGSVGAAMALATDFIRRRRLAWWAKRVAVALAVAVGVAAAVWVWDDSVVTSADRFGFFSPGGFNGFGPADGCGPGGGR